MTIHCRKIQVTKGNILYVHYGENWLRGSEIVLLNLLKLAKENNYTPVLWCNSKVLAEHAATLGIEVILDEFVCIGYWTIPKWNFLQYFKLLGKAKKILSQYQISLVHCNNGAPCQWMVPICKLSNIPLLLHLHARYMYRDRLTLLFHGADTIVGVSKSVTALFKANEFNKQQVSTIYNGIDPKRVLTPSPRDIRTELSAKENDFVILYVGSLIPRKSVHQLLYALDKLKEYTNIKLAIVGTGSEQEKLSTLTVKLGLTDKVSFFADSDNVAEVYSSNVDCFVSVPAEEVFGLTLAEASLAKLPIITTKISGIDEIYTDKSSALLISPNSIDELADAIQSLVQNPFLRRKLASNAYKHVMQTFSVKKQFSSFESAYQSLSHREIKKPTFKKSLSTTVIHALKFAQIVIKTLLGKCYKRLVLSFSWGK